MSAPPNIWAVVPEILGKHGHPYIAGRELIEAFLAGSTHRRARDIEHRHQDHIQYVAVDDPFVALNINTPEDYAALWQNPLSTVPFVQLRISASASYRRRE